MSPTPEEVLDEIASWLHQASRAVAFTGAGISTESGIPDFRSPGGIWARNDPVYFDDFLSRAEARREYWRQKSESHGDFATARPNVGHQVLAGWEAAGWMAGVITQNIDGLHQDAGSRRVVELHGTARYVGCLECPARYDAGELVETFLDRGEPPLCQACGGLLKHATVSFGQALPSDAIQEASALSGRADVMLAIGSSLVVYPAAGFPELARQKGATLVIINRDATPLDSLAHAIVRAPIGVTLAALDQRLRETTGDVAD